MLVHPVIDFDKSGVSEMHHCAGRLVDDKGMRRRVFESGVEPVRTQPLQHFHIGIRVMQRSQKSCPRRHQSELVVGSRLERAVLSLVYVSHNVKGGATYRCLIMPGHCHIVACMLAAGGAPRGVEVPAGRVPGGQHDGAAARAAGREGRRVRAAQAAVADHLAAAGAAVRQVARGVSLAKTLCPC